MSIKQIVLLIISLSVLGLSAQKERSTVFKSNSEGYAIFRIPAIVSIPNGDLLAFCEGRENIDDFGNVDIVMKRSSDRGKTWSKLKVLVDYGQLQAGNSAPVVDLLDPEYPQGRVFLFYNTGNNHEYDVRIKTAIERFGISLPPTAGTAGASLQTSPPWFIDPIFLRPIQSISLRKIGEHMPTHPDTPCSLQMANIRAGYMWLQITPKDHP